MMADGIGKVCVIGAGTMGAAIAAQVANAGVPVLLLDIVPKEGADRDAIAKAAVERMLNTEPAPFMSRRAAKLVETGNIDDHLERAAECDWIIEAVVERLDIKQSLYARIDAIRRPGTAVSSNTSTIPLAQLVEGRSEDFTAGFLVTHFFNPPRYMRLLELVTGPGTDPAIAAKVENFSDRMLGKHVVHAKDTPGFIANRIGTYWLQVAVNAAMDLGLTVEEADAIGGQPMGIPKTGIFGLIDLVGLDLMPMLQKSLGTTLPPDDAYHATVRPWPVIETMIADGFTGRKGKGGFYRLNREKGRSKEAIDLTTGAYRPAITASVPRVDLRELIAMPGKTGDFAWGVLGKTLTYAASLVPEAADTILVVDDAMKLGYNWKYGPFELIDRIGAAAFAKRLEQDGVAVPPLLTLAGDRSFYRFEGGIPQYLGLDGAYHAILRPEGVLLLEDVKRGSTALLKNGSAALWDIGDGVACLEFTSKMNALDGESITLLVEAITLVQAQYKALVLYTDASDFSAGANLGLALFAANIAAWSEIETLITAGQQAYKAMKYAPFPVVAAPAGMALGGGCEIILHADAAQAHAECYTGLVECGVGLVPGWGGNGEMIDRWSKSGRLPRGPMPAVAKVFEIVSTATVSKSAAEAQDHLFLRDSDGITMNRERLLADAKAKALSLVDGYAPPEAPTFHLPGASGRVALSMAAQGFRQRGLATDYDLVVSGSLATVLTGGDADPVDNVSEADLSKLEHDQFMTRLRDPRTLARIEQMLETGKPLRN